MQHNLPHPPYQRLIGRDAEVAEIERRLAPDSRHWLIAIEGMAGMGKTALALEIGWRCVAERRPPALRAQRFDACVWACSASDLTASSPLDEVATRHTTLNDVYRAIAHVLDAPYILRLPESEQQDAVLRLLASASAVLLIVDNLDPVHSATITPFLRELPPPSKAILTLRLHEDIPYPIRLQPLDDASARALSRQLCDAQRLRLGEDEIAAVAALVGGLPLAAQWVVGLVKEYGIGALPPRWADHASSMLRHLFDDAVHRLRKTHYDAYTALLALALFDLQTGASVSALAFTSEMDPVACEQAILHLLQLNLIARSDPDLRLVMLPLTSAYVHGEMTHDPSLEPQLRNAWIRYYRSYLDGPRDVVRYADWRTEWSNVRLVMEWLAAHDMMDDLAWFFIQIHEFLLFESLWEPLLSFAEQVAAWAELHGDLDTLAAILRAPIDVFLLRDKLDAGEVWLDRARALIKHSWKQPTPRLERLEAEVMLATTRLRDNDTVTLRAAVARPPAADDTDERMEKALAFFSSHGDADGVLRTLYVRGNQHRRHRHYPKAAKWYRLGLDQLSVLFTGDPAREAWWRPILRSRLAIVTGRQGHHEEARDMLSAVLPELHEPQHQIEALAALAYYEHVTGHRNLARQHRVQAEKLKARLRITPPICLEDARWGQWTLA